MLGKITKADIQLQTKFVKLINLYAQLVFFNMLEEEFGKLYIAVTRGIGSTEVVEIQY